MTAKRFDWDVCEGDALFYEDGAVIDYDDVVELLNELHEENMMLKGEVAHYKLILMSLEEQAKRLSRIHCLGDKE